MHLRPVLAHHPFHNLDVAFIRRADGEQPLRVDHHRHEHLLLPLRVLAVRGDRVAAVDLLPLDVEHVFVDAVALVVGQIEHRLNGGYAADDLIPAGIQIVLDAHFAGRPGERGGDALKHPAVAAARDDEMHALLFGGQPLHRFAQRRHRAVPAAIHAKGIVRGGLQIDVAEQPVHRLIGHVARHAEAADLQRSFQLALLLLGQMQAVARLQAFKKSRLHRRAAGIIQNAEHAVPALLLHHPG